MLHGNTHSMGPPQRLSFALGHADVIKLALALQLGNGPVGILERHVRVNTGGLEEVETLSAPQGGVDPVDTTSQVLRATVDGSVSVASSLGCKRTAYEESGTNCPSFKPPCEDQGVSNAAQQPTRSPGN